MTHAAGSEDRDILVCGMFDMRNFGDLMFPLIARHELGRRGYRVHALSPTGADTGLREAMPSRPIWSALETDVPCAGILIGGGYTVHTHRMDMLLEYRGSGIGAAVAPSTWLGATLVGALRDVPVAWNTPGVPHPMRPGVKALATAAFSAADYMSLRDDGSVRMAGLTGDAATHVVPDTVLGIDRLWPRDSLKPDFERLCQRLGVADNSRVIAIHVRRRSLGDTPMPVFAAALAETCRQHDLTPILIGLGTAHSDDRISRELSAELTALGRPNAALDRPEGLRDIAALLAHSRAYAGSSLHGYIVAAAYSVPGVLVARPAYRKFDGLIRHLDRHVDKVGDWQAALDGVARSVTAPPPSLPAEVDAALDRHWTRIAAAFDKGPEPGRARRLTFAALAMSEGLHQGGPDWAMLPFTTAQDRAAAATGDDVREKEPF